MLNDAWILPRCPYEEYLYHAMPAATMQISSCCASINASCCAHPFLQAHQDVLNMADPDESDPLKRLAALLLHAADLANGADAWTISKLWARMCHRGKRLTCLNGLCGRTTAQCHFAMPQAW
jgi:hypothetical protein